jgi:hypothetical protein
LVAIGITWCRRSKGKNYFSTQEWLFFAAVLRRANKFIGLRVGERGVCIVRIGSNQSSTFLI